MMKRDLMKEERNMLAQTKVLNWFVNFEDGSNCLIYCDQPGISDSTIRRFAEKTAGDKVIEVYHVPQKDLQYCCIDERVWVDTPKKAEKLIQIAES